MSERERNGEREKEKESERDIGVRVVGIEAGGERKENERGEGRDINE